VSSDVGAEVVIREARREELATLQAIEVAAGRQFERVGMPEIADDEPPTVERLESYPSKGRAWVAVDPHDFPVGYVIADEVDGAAHIEQVSVHPDNAGAGVGRALIDLVGAWAKRRGLPAVTLTTFAQVPWNAPYYERLGFRPLADDEITPGLAEIRRREHANGLDKWPRVSMRREV
jgi:GNAT superfamily N-acetyltransferase